jgi:hypothetical protein
VSETTKKITVGGTLVIAAVALGYLALREGEELPEIDPLPTWQEAAPEVARVPPLVVRPLDLSGLAFGTGGVRIARVGDGQPEELRLAGVPQVTLAEARLNAARVYAGAAEQTLARNGTLQVATAQVNAPAVPEWLDGWFWPRWRGAPPEAPQGACPVVVWSAARRDAAATGPHLVAVVAGDTTPMGPLAEYLAADAQAVAVIIGWEETGHDHRPDAQLDAARAEAVAKVIRAARPGLPVWLLCSLTVTGTPEQAAAKVDAAKPDALVLYGLFGRAAWESDKAVTANLAKGQKLLPDKPVYAAGQRLVGDDLQTAIDRARRLGWGGVICDGSAR